MTLFTLFFMKRKKIWLSFKSNLSLLPRPGIEPGLQSSQDCVLSIERSGLFYTRIIVKISIVQARENEEENKKSLTPLFMKDYSSSQYSLESSYREKSFIFWESDFYSFYILLIIFFTTPITFVSSRGSISTLSKNLLIDSRNKCPSCETIFLSLGRLLWTTNT